MKKKILVVDDDKIFVEVLCEALAKRNLEVSSAYSVNQAIEQSQIFMPDMVVADLKMPGLSGLHLIHKLKELKSDIQIVILTGYASINTAVEAIKLGAIHYLVKPANADDILAAFDKNDSVDELKIVDNHVSIHNLELETIQATLKITNFNISETARRLGLHRRTLQRKLQKQNFIQS